MTPSLIIVRSFNAPHRTGLVDFPHPALQSNSLVHVKCKSYAQSWVLVTDSAQGNC